ncbi:MAG TPA: HEAT repeat domain-containing protein [Planctomycetota bacterium]|nr:HEAT repeat domain-containing protein [Planctomycetota bacterium]
MRKSVLIIFALGAVAFAGDDPVAAFKKAFSSSDENARVAAVNQIASVKTRSVVKALGSPVAHDPSAAVRKAAAKALGGQYASNLAAKELANALHPDDDPADVTAAVVAALGETQSDVAVPVLLSALKTRARVYRNGGAQAAETVAASGAILDALKRAGSAQATNDLVSFLLEEEPPAQVRGKRNQAMAKDPLLKKAQDTLTALTGEHLTVPEQWSDWWNDNKGSLRTVVVMRCEVTGKTYDRLPTGKPCPHCGSTSCSFALRTRFENVTADPAAVATAQTTKKKQ